jgi:GTP1/Obg family GTP-binding protein
MKTTWKDIAPVPTSQEFLDIVLSRTQRRLPTQIRAGFKISRIRGVSHSVVRGRKDLVVRDGRP